MTSQPNQDIILLQTKLNRPWVTKDLVIRPRLGKMLDTGAAGPLTLVVAPAGFGKTTLVSSWLSEVNRDNGEPIPAAWLTLDEGDQDRVTLLRYFISALQTIFPDACLKTLSLINAHQEPPLSLLSNTLINELEMLPSSFIIVLDDFYTIRDPIVLDFLDDFVQHWPRRMHMIILSRHNPPLPLAMLRAKGLLTEIRIRDLRFSADETAEYFSKSLGDSPDETALALFQRQMEGWIAGLKMIVLSMEDRHAPRALDSALRGGDIYITDYLVDEVFNRQPPSIRHFLLTASIVDRFSGSLCETLVAGDGSDCHTNTCLDHIVAKELFVTPLDTQREWYRFHRIFRDFLRRRLLDTLPPEQFKALHGRAAEWFAAHDLPDQAIHHALECGDFDMAARFMIGGLRDVLNREDRPTLERWLHLLPEPYSRHSPELLLIRTWVHAMKWEYDKMMSVVEELEAFPDDDERLAHIPYLEEILASIKAHYYYYFNQYDQAVTNSRKCLTSLPEDWRYVRGAASVYLGLSLYSTGRSDLAEKFIAEQYRKLSRTRLDGRSLRLLLARAINAIHAAHYEAAERTAKTLAREAAAANYVLPQSWGVFLQGLVNYEWNAMELAAQQFTEGIDVSFGVNLIVARNTMIGLAYATHALGDSVNALETIDWLGQLDLERHGIEADDTAAARARLQFISGDLEAAERWADHYNAPLTRATIAPFMERPQLTKARILIARNTGADIQMAMEILDEFGRLAERTFNFRVTIEVLALHALAKLSLGDSAGAQTTLIRAVELARRGVFTRTFVDLGPQMQKLLHQIAGHRPTMQTVGRILAAFEGNSVIQRPVTKTAKQQNTHRTRQAIDGPHESLTPREREVLALMAEPIGLKVIASRMNISYATARRYTISIYSKFGVHSRWEAVDSAVQKGIISPR